MWQRSARRGVSGVSSPWTGGLKYRPTSLSFSSLPNESSAFKISSVRSTAPIRLFLRTHAANDNLLTQSLAQSIASRSSRVRGVRNYSTQSEPPKQTGDPNTKAILLALGAVSFGSAFLLFLLGYMKGTMGSKETDFQSFVTDFLLPGKAELLQVDVEKKRVYIKPKGTQTEQTFPVWFSISDVSLFEKNLEETQELLGIDPFDFVPVSFNAHSMWWENLVLECIPILFIVGSILVLQKVLAGKAGGGGPGGLFGIGQSKAQRYDKNTKVKVTFADVAGLDEAKTEIMEFVSFLKNPQKYQALGAKIPKGALLVGPPGTGKTLLAKATAGEAGVPFFTISGSDFLELFVGVGPSRVRDLFKKARESAPSIIFIDEIDAVGRSRSKSGFSNDERENTLNQMLVEMDGFNPSTNVVVLAGTNRADVLDEALLRPGRFDRQIYIDLPDLKERKAIYEVHLKKLKLKDSIETYSKRLTTLTPGFAGADIANVCNEAALVAARKKKSAIELIDFEQAIERIIGGLEKKERLLSREERTRVAYHEAGHAVVGWFLEHANPLLKVSIVPRGVAALGYAQYQPIEQRLHTREQILDAMCVALGGRAAEAIFFNKITTGAQDDLRKVTKMAYDSITVYGMNEKVGFLSLKGSRGQGEFFNRNIYSQATGNLIDEEVRNHIAEAYTRTENLLKEKREHLEKVAKRLLRQEILNAEDLEELLGKRPWEKKSTYDELTGDINPPAPEVTVETAPPPPSSSSPSVA